MARVARIASVQPRKGRRVKAVSTIGSSRPSGRQAGEDIRSSPSALIRHLRRSTLWLSVLVFLLSGVLGSGLVLCIGAQGHFAIETIDVPPHPAGVQFAPASDCIDLPGVELARPSWSQADGPPPLLALLYLVWPLLFWRRPVRQPPCRWGGPDPRLVQHRTVVLLN